MKMPPFTQPTHAAPRLETLEERRARVGEDLAAADIDLTRPAPWLAALCVLLLTLLACQVAA